MRSGPMGGPLATSAGSLTFDGVLAALRPRHDSEIIMRNTLSFPPVRFPHDAHNLWMSCEMCHDRIFKPEIDGNDISMSKILDGEYCGLCHGAVAFPLTECNRCHSVVREGQVPSVSGAVVGAS